MKRITKWLLAYMERRYLKAHGWRPVAQDKYLAPLDYSFRDKGVYVRRHAVNAQHAVYGVYRPSYLTVVK